MKAYHTIFLGQTGSGKTSMARMLVSLAPRLIVMDSTEDAIWNSVGSTFRDADRASRFFMQNIETDFQAVFRFMQPQQFYDFLDMAYQFQNTQELPPLVIVVEESGLFSDSHSIPEALENVIARGRRAGISIVSIAQEATQINPRLRRQGMVTISLRQTDVPATTAAIFGDRVEALETLQTLDPFTRPIYGTHYLTSPPDEQVFRNFAETVINPGTQELPEDYDPPI